MSDYKAWRQVVTPHEDVRKGRFDASVYAADLGAAMAGRGAVDYRDPVVFLNKTFLTHGLTELLAEVMQRLSGQIKGEPVIQLQTPFGGGKTHTLLAAYHLFNDAALIANHPAIKKLLYYAGLKTVPNANLACLVGTAMNVTSDRTLWGEMAYQLGGETLYKMIEKEDKSRTAPGSKLLSELLEKSGPSLILMDETLAYLLKAGGVAGVKVGESTLRGQTLQFIEELTIAASNSKDCVFVITLTSGLAEFLDEEAERMYQSLEKVVGRVEKVRLPVEGEEIYGVIRQRLFENLGDISEQKKTTEAYWKMYSELGDDVPAASREPVYRDRMLAAYPFHPEFISCLFERWGSIVEFQRTRGVLRLLAYVINHLYNKKDNEPLIQSCSVCLDNTDIRGELVKFVGQPFHGVIASDIAGPEAKAPEIDRGLGSEYARESVSEKLARAIFMYSFGSQHAGATLPQLRLAILNPEMAPPFVGDAIDRMGKKLWFLYSDGGLYRFESRQNLNRTILDREEMIRADIDKVRDYARNCLNDLVGEAAFRVFRYPKESRDIADDSRVSLVVLDFDQVVAEGGIPKKTDKFISDLLKQHGSSFRKHANMLVFLCPDNNQAPGIVEAATRLLALKAVSEDRTTKKQLTDEQEKDLLGRLKDAEVRLPVVLQQTYRHIVIPGDKKTLRCFDMGIQSFGTKQTLGDQVMEFLKGHELMLSRLDPALIIGTRWSLWPAKQRTLKVKALADYFTQLTHLPMLTDVEVLQESIAQGVKRGLFACALGDGEKNEFDTIYFKQHVSASDCLIEDSAWLLKADFAKELIPEPAVAESGKVIGGDIKAGEEKDVETKEPRESKNGEVRIVDGERRLDRVRITMRVPWEQWHDVYNEVIEPLANEGANIITDITLVARSEGGIRENTVELGIKESLSQRRIDANVETS